MRIVELLPKSIRLARAATERGAIKIAVGVLHQGGAGLAAELRTGDAGEFHDGGESGRLAVSGRCQKRSGKEGEAGSKFHGGGGRAAADQAGTGDGIG